MDELTTTFAKARFGEELTKEALNPAFMEQVKALANMPELPENKRKLRDLIEKSVREEQRRLAEAKKLISYGKQRVTDPERMGGAGTLMLDTLRSMIPGMSISASAETPMEKAALEDPDEGLGGRAFDLAHALTAATGAGAGVAAQKGLFGGRYGADVAEKLIGGATPLAEAIGAALPDDTARSALRSIAGEGVDDLTNIAAQRHTPVVNKLMRLFSPTEWSRRFHSLGASPTSAEAQATLVQKLIDKGIDSVRANKLVREQLPEALVHVTNQAKLLPDAAKRIPGGWKGGLAGAALLSLPFMLARLYKTRKLRERGGTAAGSAAEKAERLLAEAAQLRERRRALFAGG